MARFRIAAAGLALLIAPALGLPARADETAVSRETFGDWTVEQARAEDGSALCRFSSDVEGMMGEAGLVATADGALFFAFRDDRVRMPGEWVGRTVGVAFPDGACFTLPVARLLHPDGARRPANTLLARLDAPGGDALRPFYADGSLSVLLPDGSVHDALLGGAGDAAEAMAACARRIAAAPR